VFVSVREAQRQAQKRLPPAVYGALLGGSEANVSYRDNTDAFAQLGFAPRVAARPAAALLGTTLMGRTLSFPVIISPAGVQAVHPEGEVAAARAAAAKHTALGLSSFAGRSLSEVVAVNPATFYQLCWAGTRTQTAAQLERAAQAGAAGLILTLDWAFTEGRDHGSPTIPERLDLRTAIRFAPQALRRPRWSVGFARAGRRPDLKVPNLGDVTFFEAYRAWQRTPPPTWDDIAWLRERWRGPFMIKGISRPDDACRAVAAGATAISVSNHGGNDLDGIPAPIRLLPGIAGAVGHEVEVLLDGGVRWGSDVAKALALGARAVMIGRAALWGLAAAGQPGVEHVLDLLRHGLERTLLTLGVASVHDLSRDDLVVPPSFC
jgi:pre-mycofactocin synthase